MRHILLLGAGFSRNWGGWLASEAFEYMLGVGDLDAQTRQVLWDWKDRGGFEDALAALQNELIRRRTVDAERRLEAMQGAVSQMFRDMDSAFAAVPFEPQKLVEYTVARFLARFDVIFTLNQDTLLERHYLNENVSLSSGGRWSGYQLPGMRLSQEHDPIRRDIGTWFPLARAEFKMAKNLQPFIKLHGSWNWIADGGRPLLIIGGNKAREIAQHPILSWNFEQLNEHLSHPNTRLMVIGYSFRDEHVDQAICNAATRNNLELFIVDPLGVDVLNENRNVVALITAESPRSRQLKPHLIGASRRSISETFRNDRAEFAKVMRFFE